MKKKSEIQESGNNIKNFAKEKYGGIKSQNILKLQENSPVPSCASELERRFPWFIFPLDTHWLAWYSN